MAYHDENGRITIDEAAANRDIRRLREAADILRASQASIRSLRQQSTDMKGLAAQAIQEKSTEMERKLTQMIDKLESTADYIQRVVKHYQKIDEDLKRLIEQTALAAQRAAQQAAQQTATQQAVQSGVGINWSGPAFGKSTSNSKKKK